MYEGEGRDILFPQVGYADYFYSLFPHVMVFSTLCLCVILVFIREYLSLIPSFNQSLMLMEKKHVFLFCSILSLFCFACFAPKQAAKPEMVPGKLL